MKVAVLLILFSILNLVAKAQDNLPTEPLPPLPNKAEELSYSMIGQANPDGSTDVYYHFIMKIIVGCDYPGAPKLLPLFINDLGDFHNLKQVNLVWDSASNDVQVADPCIAFGRAPCYRIFYYHGDQHLDFNQAGYSVFFPDCCRDGYQNLRTTSNQSQFEGWQMGLVWAPPGPLEPPPYRPLLGYATNSMAFIINIPSRFKFLYNGSPTFDNNSDTILYVCNNQPFSHLFSATDPDGDSLVYSFTPSQIFNVEPSLGAGLLLKIQTNGGVADIAYKEPAYTGTQPLGEDVTIDSKTGLVQGRMHDTGTFLFSVGVTEYRSGKLVTAKPHMRDVILKSFDCSKLPTPVAKLPPLLNNCDSSTITLPNLTTPYHPELYWDNNKYLWNFGDGDTSRVRYPTHTFDTGAYNVQLVTMAGYRCADTANMKVLVYPSVHPRFNIVGQSCTGTSIKFVNTSSTDIGAVNSLKWTFTNLKDSSYFTSNLSTPTYTFKVPDQSYSVILHLTTDKGCDASDTQYVDVRQSPLRLQTHDTIITAGVPFILHASSGYDTTGSVFFWSPSIGLDNPFSSNPVATGTENITYKVQVTNSFGCTLTDTIHLVYYKGPDIYLPNAFTPNRDGINDVFRPFPVGIKKLDYFRVFNRWGNIVYQTQVYLAGWDGYKNGKPEPPGTYIFEVRGTDLNGKIVLKRGTVLLLR